MGIENLIQRWRRRRQLAQIAKNFAHEGGLSGRNTETLPEIENLRSVLREAEPLPMPAAYVASRTDAAPRMNWSVPALRLALAGGAAATIAAFSIIVFTPPAATEYATRVGETTTVALQDGSELFLSGNTSASVRFTKNARSITLNSGEATFDVAHDPARPFSVDALNTTIVAVGTEFNVSRRDNVEVDVLEGRVLVSLAQNTSDPVSVSAGGRAIANMETGDIDLASAETERIRSLQRGRLYFDNTPLSEAFEEFEPFSPLRARITDATLANLTVSGSFDIAGIEDFILSVEQALNANVRRSGHVVVVSPSP
ncbi:FecR domain-containing protein [Hyphococcus flavus]|uniref:FecR domain-containing protein n=1 Tax=Hyphococcus flavus TaxID=1866326 RepID=A0AAE9ZIU9_9PROT|nr:FecR domain-containing protein [Hyphococcus flavus]WDI31836.1 FecR domain-containing protein [Hyphococcus flavus]